MTSLGDNAGLFDLLDLTQPQLADLEGLGLSTIVDFENRGPRSPPTSAPGIEVWH
jgi:hypothetical protein